MPELDQEGMNLPFFFFSFLSFRFSFKLCSGFFFCSFLAFIFFSTITHGCYSFYL